MKNGIRSAKGRSMRAKTGRVAFGLVAAMWSAACLPPPAPEVSGPPQRIVSMSPGLTETVCAVGCGDRLVAVTDYCRYPEKVRQLPKVGGYLDPNVEAIVALEPDLVLLMESQGELGPRLSRLGLRTAVVSQHDITAVLQSFVEVAELCGSRASGEALQCDVRAHLGRISQLLAREAAPRVLAVVARPVGNGSIESVWAAAPSTFVGDVITFAGGRNALETGVGEGAYPEVSVEGLIHLDPDVILDLVSEEQGEGLTKENLRADWQNLTVLSAVQADRVEVLRQPFLVVPGPRVAEVVETVARRLHPEARW